VKLVAAEPSGPTEPTEPTQSKMTPEVLTERIRSHGGIIVDGIAATPVMTPNEDTFRMVMIDGEFFLVLRNVTSRMMGHKFANAVRVNEDGSIVYNEFNRAEKYVIKYGYGRAKPVVIWEGTIEATMAYRAFEITPSRMLNPLEWSRYVRLIITNPAGIVERHNVPVMQLKQPQSKAEWLDETNIGLSGRPTDCKNFVMCLLAALPENGMVIHGQGPVRLDDGTLIFCAKSIVFDDKGEIRSDITVDMSGLDDMYRYYDITPIKEISDEQIIDGCNELLAAYDECPKYPEIPAAFLGQLHTAVLPRIDSHFFSAIIQAGLKGSGKTFYSARFDSIQSRILRGDVREIMPVINLGDTTGTAKGPKYRIREFGGFAVTTDDVIKSGDSPFRIAERSEAVSNMIRSFLSGGGASARVNRAIQRVVSAESIMLHSSIKFASEKLVTGDSTLDRAIVLPQLSDPWGDDGAFDTTIAIRLSMPDSRELQHRAWSALEYWIFQRIDTIVRECLTRAMDVVRAWDVESRIADNYAALIAGHFIFGEFCAEHNIDATPQITRAIDALKECAIRQAALSIPLVERFRTTMRQALSNGKIAIPGRPIADPDGMPTGTYGPPWLNLEPITNEDGTTEYPRTMPPYIDNPDNLGLVARGKNFAPKGTAIVHGYVMPPRKGGRNGTDLSTKWTAVFPTGDEKWQNLCHTLTDFSRTRRAFTFDANELLDALESAEPKLGGKTKIRILEADKSVKVNQSAVIEIDWAWLFSGDEG
jgi:hypothetical protein